LGSEDEVQGAEGTIYERAASHKEVILAGHVFGVLQGPDEVVGRRRVRVRAHEPSAGKELLQEEADIEGGGHGVGEGEELAGAGSPADAVGALGRPVQQREPAGGVAEGDQIASLGPGEGQDRGAGVIGEDGDLEGGEVQLGIVEDDGQAGERGERVIDAAGVGAGGVRHVFE